MIQVSFEPEVTVLITAHNEAETIQLCLRAIVNQDFPMERVEILLIDDRSTDGTADRARELGLERLRVITISEPPRELSARQTALDLGIREARGEVVLITAADGRVPRVWIRELTGHMGYRDGAVTAPVIYGGNHQIHARHQTMESLVVFTLYRLFHRHRLTAGVSSSNVAVRRSAYLESGGFSAVGFMASESVALAQALTRGGWSIRYLTGSAVQTFDCASLRELIDRARRKTYNVAPALTTILVLVIISNIALLAWATLGGQSFWFSAMVLLARYGFGVALVVMAIGQYRGYRSRSWIWFFEPMLTFVGLCVYLSLLVKPRWRWADIEYGRHGPEDDAQAAASPVR